MGVVISFILMIIEGNIIKGILLMIRRDDYYENVYLVLEFYFMLNIIKNVW